MTEGANEERQIENRRRFHVQSKFGSARRWRSRKNRPCDTCRRRKTACVINEQPPCSFCKERGLECVSKDEQVRPRPHNRGLSADQDDTLDDSNDNVNDSSIAEDHGANGANDTSEEIFPRTAATSESPSAVAGATVPPYRSPYGRCALDILAESPVITLEDGENCTANVMGLSAEQDTDLLASFRSIIMTEEDLVAANIVQVSAGNASAGIPPCHFNVLRDSFMTYDDRIRIEASHTIETKVGQYGSDLVRLYFKHVHPVYCVISKVRFLQAYKHDKLSIPASLRGVLYGLGAVYWDQDSGLREINRPFHQWELFHAAQASLERELDAPNLWKMQAALLMLHEQAAENNTFETARTWTLSAQATACAQMIGLHRDPTDWNIANWEISLRKKLWWAAYITDTWSSVCHGNPPHIYPASYTTADLDLADLKFDEEVPSDLQDMVDTDSSTFDVTAAARFIELVKLTQILHSLLDTSFTDTSRRKAAQNGEEKESKILGIGKDLDTWMSLMPRCVTMEFDETQLRVRKNAPLHLAYYATRVLFLRALLAPASMPARRDPGSSLRRFFEMATKELALFPLFVDSLQGVELEAYWGRHARSQLLLIGNFFVYLFLSSPNAEQVHCTFALLEQLHGSMQRISELVHGESVHLIRPLALRIDSFFTQAAQIMRGTPTTPNSDPQLALILNGRW